MASKTTQKHLAHQVKTRREKLDISKLELARRTGLALMTINRIEAGEADATTNTLDLVAKALGTTPANLLP